MSKFLHGRPTFSRGPSVVRGPSVGDRCSSQTLNSLGHSGRNSDKSGYSVKYEKRLRYIQLDTIRRYFSLENNLIAPLKAETTIRTNRRPITAPYEYARNLNI
jgi:hypothetical protein